MSLDFDVSDVKDHKNVTTAPYQIEGREQWHPVTNALVWASIPCGYNRIPSAPKDFDEVWTRINLWQQIAGGLMMDNKSEPIWLTRKDVEMHIGLATNASSKSHTEFVKAMIRHIEMECNRRAKHTSAMERIGWQGQPGQNPIK